MLNRLLLCDRRFCLNLVDCERSGSDCFLDDLPAFHHCLAASFLALQKFLQLFLKNGDLVLIDYAHLLPLLLLVVLQPSQFLLVNGQHLLVFP
jgi:hypothetical protein